eukprot:TRINITY_DN12326_c0_g1_i1.p1 TRINITY_DN12326_c0_g1~~TRINITY_DN12326_c0_g1_i1.p1  ORF type:complete len:1391 (+),score=226.79 TRINITY_DN12326_c0_g1_i1:63-4175(+)
MGSRFAFFLAIQACVQMATAQCTYGSTDGLKVWSSAPYMIGPKQHYCCQPSVMAGGPLPYKHDCFCIADQPQSNLTVNITLWDDPSTVTNPPGATLNVTLNGHGAFFTPYQEVCAVASPADCQNGALTLGCRTLRASEVNAAQSSGQINVRIDVSAAAVSGRCITPHICHAMCAPAQPRVAVGAPRASPALLRHVASASSPSVGVCDPTLTHTSPPDLTLTLTPRPTASDPVCPVRCFREGWGLCPTVPEPAPQGAAAPLICTTGMGEALSSAVSTYAGSNVSGHRDGPRLDALFMHPHSVSVGSDGSVLVVDRPAHVIRKIDLDGNVSLLAGTVSISGTADGAATSSRFNSPVAAVQSISTGDIYIADRSNNCLRILSAGMVAVFAGTVNVPGVQDGPVGVGRLSNPSGLVVTAYGIVVTDSLKHLVRLAAFNGTLSTLAGRADMSGIADGTGENARFNAPIGVAVAGDTAVMIADSANSCIRHISMTGVVVTLAGECGTSSPQPVEGIRGSARFDTPSGIAVHATSGVVYIADQPTLLRMSTEGAVSILAGQHQAAEAVDGPAREALFKSIYAVAVAGDDLFIADPDAFRIRKVHGGTAGATCLAPPMAVGMACVACEVVCVAEGAGQCPSPAAISPLQLGSTPHMACAVGSRLDPTHAVTTYAGSGTWNGIVEGLHSDVTFQRVSAISVNGADVLVSDKSAIRRIDRWGVVSILAGQADAIGYADGRLLAAMFRNPGTILPFDGEYLVADIGNHCIRRMSALAVSSWAGTCTVSGMAPGGPGVGLMGHPVGMVWSMDRGVVYASDQRNHVIWAIGAWSGVLVQIAGNGTAGFADGVGFTARFNTPWGLTVSESGVLLIVDRNNNCIRTLDNTSSVVATIAGICGTPAATVDGPPGTARFNAPSDIVMVASTGALYVVEFGGKTIRHVSPAGFVTTVAGLAGTSGHRDGAGWNALFQTLYGIAWHGEDLLLADGIYVRRMQLDGARCASNASAIPVACAACTVLCVNHNLGNCATSIAPIQPQASPSSFCATGTEVTYVNVVSTYAGAGSNGTADGPAPNATFSTLVGVTADANGDVIVVDAHKIRVIMTNGTVSSLAGTGVPGHVNGRVATAQFSSPTDILADGRGGYYVADRGNHCIRRILDGTVKDYAGTCGTPGTSDGPLGTGRLSGPAGLAISPLGDLYIADSETNQVRSVTPSGVLSSVSLATPFSAVHAVFFDSTGTLCMLDATDHCIRRRLPNGTLETVLGLCGATAMFLDGNGSQARLHTPRSIRQHSSGDLYMVEGGNLTRVRRIVTSPTWQATSLTKGFVVDGPGEIAGFMNPQGIAVVGDMLYVTDQGKYTVRRVDMQSSSQCNSPFQPVNVVCTS